jgi:hypothetical protein
MTTCDFAGAEIPVQLRPFQALAKKGRGMEFGVRCVLAWGGVTDFGLAAGRL